MKKLSTSVSPFLMLVVPVLIFAGLSLNFNQDDTQDLSSSFSTKQVKASMVSVGQQSLVKFLLKK